MADLNVTIGGDASGVAGASNQARGAITGLQSTARNAMSTFQQLGQSLQGAFNKPISTNEVDKAVDHSKSKIDELGKEADKASAMFERLAERLAELFAIREIAEWSSKMGEAAEHMAHLQAEIGTTSLGVANLNAVATSNGMSLDQISNAMIRLSRNMGMAAEGGKRQSAAFRELGISVSASADPLQTFMQLSDKFASMPDGTAKITLAYQLMGRTGAQLIPILDQGSDALREQMQTAVDLGATFGTTSDQQDAFQQKGLALAEVNNQLKLGFQGIANVLLDALGPTIVKTLQWFVEMIKAFVQSYREGGQVAQVMNALNLVLEATITVVGALAVAVVDTFSVLQAGAEIIIGALYTLGQVVIDVLSGDFGKASADAVNDMNAVSKSVQDAIHNAAQFQRSYAGLVGSFINPKPLTPIKLPKGDAGGDMPNLGGGGHGKKAHDDRVQQWTDQLHQQLVAEQNYFADSKSEELKFWEDKLQLTAAGSKARQEVESKIYDLKKSLAQQDLQNQLANLTAQQDANKDDFSKRMSLEDQKLALLAKDYGQDSKQYQDELRRKEQMTEQYEQQVVKLAEERITNQAKLDEIAAQGSSKVALAALQERENVLKQQSSSGRISKPQEAAGMVDITAQRIQLENSAADQIYNIHLKELQDEAALQNLRPEERQKILDQITQLETQHAQDTLTRAAQDATEMEKVQADAAQATQQAWEQRLQPIGSAFDTVIQGMLKGTETFQQLITQAGMQLADSMIKAGEQWLIQHIAQQLTATTVTTTQTAIRSATETSANAASVASSAASSLSQLGHSAAVAAGKSFQALAGIPIIGPILGAAAAVATFAAVMALGSGIASAAGGQDRVPFDGQVTELHKDEMVLSAKYANPLRNALTGASFGSPGAALTAASRDGGFRGALEDVLGGVAGGKNGHTFNYQPTVNAPTSSWDDIVRSNGDDMKRWVSNQIRNGSIRVD